EGEACSQPALAQNELDPRGLGQEFHWFDTAQRVAAGDPRAVLVNGVAAGLRALCVGEGEDWTALMTGVVIAEWSGRQTQPVSAAVRRDDCRQRRAHGAAQYLHSRLWVQRIGVPLLGKLLAAGEHAECVGLPGAKLGEHVDLVVERLPCQGWVRSEVLRLR